MYDHSFFLKGPTNVDLCISSGCDNGGGYGVVKMRFSASKITVARCLQSILFQNIMPKAQCAPSGVGAISPFQEEC